jgi:hypothetical protein
MMYVRVDSGGVTESELKPHVIDNRHTPEGLLIRIWVLFLSKTNKEKFRHETNYESSKNGVRWGSAKHGF